MRALKNRTLKYLDNLIKDTGDNVPKKAVLLGREQRKKRNRNQIDLRKELLRRQLEKHQAKDTSTRKKLEHRLKCIDIDKIRDEFHDLEDNKLENLTDIMSGKSIGYNICHAWFDDGKSVLYSGKIEKVKMKT